MVTADSGKKDSDMRNMYEDHFTSIPKLSDRIGFCSVSMIARAQLIIKNATIINTKHYYCNLLRIKNCVVYRNSRLHSAHMHTARMNAHTDSHILYNTHTHTRTHTHTHTHTHLHSHTTLHTHNEFKDT